MPGGPPAVEALVKAAVVADQQVIGIPRIDREVVVIHMHPRRAHRLPGGSAVLGPHQVYRHSVEPVEAVRIGKEFLVVLRIARTPVAHAHPALPAIIGAVETAVFPGRGNGGIDHVGILRRDGQPDPPPVLALQAALYLAPAVAPVGALVDGRFRSAGDEDTHMPATLVTAGVQNVGIARVENHVGDPGHVADMKHSLPAPAAVTGAVEPPLAAVGPERTLGGREDRAGIARIDHDPGDVLGAFEPHPGPARTAVSALIYPVPETHAALAVVFARSHPDDLRIAGIDRDRPDRVGTLLVEDRLPGGPGVDRLPDAPRSRHQVPGVRFIPVDGQIVDPTREQSRSDRPQSEPGQHLGRNSCSALGQGARRTGEGAESDGRDETEDRNRRTAAHE